MKNAEVITELQRALGLAIEAIKHQTDALQVLARELHGRAGSIPVEARNSMLAAMVATGNARDAADRIPSN